MSHLQELAPTSPIRRRHVLAGAALCAIAPVIAANLSSIVAGVSLGPASATASPAASPDATRSDAGAVAMGSLRGPGYRVELLATTEGVRYTVRDASGTIVGERLTSEEAGKLLEGQEPGRMVTVRQSPLMLADEPSMP